MLRPSSRRNGPGIFLAQLRLGSYISRTDSAKEREQCCPIDEALGARIRRADRISGFPPPACIRVVHIEETHAQLGDDAALTTLLASVPLPGLVGPLLHKPFSGPKWDSARQSDRWLASDGTTAVSFSISERTAPDTRGIRARSRRSRVPTGQAAPRRV